MRIYDPKLLNDSFAQINTTITNGTVRAPGYLFATLIAYNATDSITPDTGTVSSTAGTGGGSNGTGGPNTSLAMIILYAITGCVSALFCVVIVSGAIRAIRHPERYGPRSGDVVFGGPPGSGFGAAQSRARGLTRAILDTFPVVKFGRNEAAPADPARPKDLEHGITETRTNDSLATDRTGEANMELKSWEEVHYSSREAVPGLEAAAYSQLERESEEIEEVEAESPRASSSASVPPVVIPRSRRPVAGRLQVPSSGDRDIVPDAIGRETCPICIVDFEEGDDLRVLPCEGHHRFHQECVDQWLLELSSSCPLCRQDFQALQTMMAGDSSDHLEPPHMPEAAARPLSSAAARFSRYLRFARRRHGGREGPHGYDPTNPPMPVAAETTLQQHYLFVLTTRDTPAHAALLPHVTSEMGRRTPQKRRFCGSSGSGDRDGMTRPTRMTLADGAPRHLSGLLWRGQSSTTKMGCSKRQSFTDKAGSALKPDSEKSTTEHVGDKFKGTSDSIASTLQPQVSFTVKVGPEVHLQQAGDAFSGNSNENEPSMMEKAKNAVGLGET
ncbi:Receptor y region, transmembrane domain- and RING domain-containing protein 4 [Grifola frondosa]|uniref:Receptor y region, transmembrane domain-and RING domain-containing protein 4 n=1 Tax=Grifola frondosa TaxID=5627 RepID=A0A1C7M2T0_GRIFR|nr:Receptor y region, transmembrane domain- and RING domain-containing protein 4 [Grifola frondosa]